MDHADYVHYGRIMSNPNHFESIFEAGFDDPAAVTELMDDARRLRARSHDARDITADDLLALSLTWRTIERGLSACVGDYQIDGWQ
jgi:hypothetical protein